MWIYSFVLYLFITNNNLLLWPLWSNPHHASLPTADLRNGPVDGSPTVPATPVRRGIEHPSLTRRKITTKGWPCQQRRTARIDRCRNGLWTGWEVRRSERTDVPESNVADGEDIQTWVGIPLTSRKRPQQHLDGVSEGPAEGAPAHLLQ